jgi:hypothetical protein
MSLALRGVAVALLACTGCPPTNAPPPPQYGPPQPQGPGAQASALTCWQIIQCYTPCGTDATCLDGCLQRGDPTAQAQVTAVIDCSTRCNNDPSCVRASCADPVATCQQAGGAVATSPPPPAGGPEPPHATENILPWMTGQWVSSNYQFEFNADGTVRRSSGSSLGGGCASTITASGTVTQQGDVLVMDLGPETARSCNTPVEGGPAVRVRYRIRWQPVADYSTGSEQHIMKLTLVELDCAKGGDLYCTELMTRR